MGCLAAARYSMTAQVYEESVIQQRSGAIKRDWNYDIFNTIECQIQPVKSKGTRNVGSTEIWGAEYADIDWVLISTSYLLTKNMRLGNFINKKGQKLYEDKIFDVKGVTPVVDPFGNILEYEILAQEAQRK